MLRIVLIALIAGCGKPDVMNDPGPDASAPDAADGYTRLIGRTWDLPAGANIYRCMRVTAVEDMYITSFVAHAPAGTHHSVLSFAGTNNTGGPDGEYDCTAVAIGMNMLYASGVGTAPLDFPPGVAIKIAAGQQLHVNLHLLNSGDEPLHGESSIWVKAQPTPPPMLAEMVFAGPLAIEIPATNEPFPVSGECTATAPYSLFAVWPHMHRLATKQTVELVRNDVATMLHDHAYDFEEQSYYPARAEVQTGDRIRVTCTYVNNTGAIVTYGDGPDKEMCFAGLYRFPAAGSNQYCPE